jgi:hypothetical protein
VRGQKINSPSPLSSPVEGEEVSKVTAGDKFVSSRLSSAASARVSVLLLTLKECRIRANYPSLAPVAGRAAPWSDSLLPRSALLVGPHGHQSVVFGPD